jgi:heptosyltransferase-2
MALTKSRSFRPLPSQQKPSRILVIRLHAIGDVAITLPYCTSLRRLYSDAQIDFLTTEPCSGLLHAVTIFDNVLIFRHSPTRLQRVKHTLWWCAKIPKFHYDVVIDLQRNWVSRSIRHSALPAYWGEFDRCSPKSAGERVQDTFQRAGLGFIQPTYRMEIRNDVHARADSILREHGWDGETKLILLNPAGLWKTRNWPIENYVTLARRWLAEERVQFLLLGTARMEQKAKYITEQLPDVTLNLVGKTTLVEAFGIVQYASAIISEDSGLMHMAWVSGVPTVVLFGSSRHMWSRPLGEHTHSLHSGDLECGACMSPECKYGDVHCLTRYSPGYVYETAQQLLHTLSSRVTV